MVEIIVAAVLSAILAGGLGYTVAVVKRDTAIALLQHDHSVVISRLDKVDNTIVGQNERIDRHLKIVVRLVVDIARKSGVEMRTVDVLEITSLGED